MNLNQIFIRIQSFVDVEIETTFMLFICLKIDTGSKKMLATNFTLNFNIYFYFQRRKNVTAILFHFIFCVLFYYYYYTGNAILRFMNTKNSRLVFCYFSATCITARSHALYDTSFFFVVEFRSPTSVVRLLCITSRVKCGCVYLWPPRRLVLKCHSHSVRQTRTLH